MFLSNNTEIGINWLEPDIAIHRCGLIVDNGPMECQQATLIGIHVR